MDGFTFDRFGNLHLILLHFPIGFAFAILLVAVYRLKHPSTEARQIQLWLLAANVGAALAAAAFGLLLASEGQYPEEELMQHRWAGIICAGCAILAWALCHTKSNILGWLGVLVLVSATTVAGHLGAILTHGPSVADFWVPLKTPPGETSPKKAPSPANIGNLKDEFHSQVQPILVRSCYDCHGNGNKKGRLNFDSRDSMLKGGKSGSPAVVPGDPAASELIKRVKLPADNDDVMPPTEDSPHLTDEQIGILEKWIQNGAKW